MNGTTGQFFILFNIIISFINRDGLETERERESERKTGRDVRNGVERERER